MNLPNMMLRNKNCTFNGGVARAKSKLCRQDAVHGSDNEILHQQNIVERHDDSINNCSRGEDLKAAADQKSKSHDGLGDGVSKNLHTAKSRKIFRKPSISANQPLSKNLSLPIRTMDNYYGHCQFDENECIQETSSGISREFRVCSPVSNEKQLQSHKNKTEPHGHQSHQSHLNDSQINIHYGTAAQNYVSKDKDNSTSQKSKTNRSKSVGKLIARFDSFKKLEKPKVPTRSQNDAPEFSNDFENVLKNMSSNQLSQLELMHQQCEDEIESVSRRHSKMFEDVGNQIIMDQDSNSIHLNSDYETGNSSISNQLDQIRNMNNEDQGSAVHSSISNQLVTVSNAESSNIGNSSISNQLERIRSPVAKIATRPPPENIRYSNTSAHTLDTIPTASDDTTKYAARTLSCETIKNYYERPNSINSIQDDENYDHKSYEELKMMTIAENSNNDNRDVSNSAVQTQQQHYSNTSRT